MAMHDLLSPAAMLVLALPQLIVEANLLSVTVNGPVRVTLPVLVRT